MRPRKWLERQPWVTNGLGALLGLWVRACVATTRWMRRGEDEVAAALREGPVVVVLWHEGLAMVGVHWRRDWGPVAALHTPRFAGRVAGGLLRHLGLVPVAMDSRKGNMGPSREILRRQREGQSIGLTGDGPQGPARVLKDAPLEWARATGRPVFVYASATRRHLRLRSWDRTVLPKPFSRGAVVWRLWRSDLPRRVDPATHAGMIRDLTNALNAAGAEAEALVGDKPGG
jgi:lysophospholipid acyltransferase (LPLAT)-like uncharacterized protein